MKLVNQYKDILLEEFYLDSDENVRRAKDGYLNRFKKDDLVTFYTNATGYHVVQIPQGIRRSVFCHALKWLLANGEIPTGHEVDHIDGNKDNNMLSNLRLVTRYENNRNRKKRSDNTSGITGIRWDEGKQRYVIRRTVGDKRLSTSRKTLDEAVLVLEEYKQMDTTYTERHGK